MKGKLEMDDNNTTSLDSAINEARRRQQSKESGTGRKHLTAEEREARKQAQAQEREQKRQEREALRAERRAKREAARKPAHMAKVEKAAQNLPEMSSDITQSFLDLTTSIENLTDIETLSAHLSHFVRAERTKLALASKVSVGQLVRINGGDPRVIGQTGTVTKVKRIRCYVDVPGFDKPVYLFTSDVSRVKKEDEYEEEQVDGSFEETGS